MVENPVVAELIPYKSGVYLSRILAHIEAINVTRDRTIRRTFQLFLAVQYLLCVRWTLLGLYPFTHRQRIVLFDLIEYLRLQSYANLLCAICYLSVIALYRGIYFTHNRTMHDIFHRTLIQSNPDYFVRPHITAKDTGKKIPVCEMIRNRLLKVQTMIQAFPIGICKLVCRCGAISPIKNLSQQF